MDFVFKGNN
jgi:hypothetical protein